MGCLAAKPVVDGLEDEVGDRALFLRTKLTGGVGEALAARYDITGVPSFLAFDRTGKLVLKKTGKVPTAELRRILTAPAE